MINMKWKPKRSNCAFRFGDGTHNSLGLITIRIPTPDRGYIHLDVDVVRPDVPLLIGLDILDRDSLVPDNVENVLESRIQGWRMPITRKHGHMYLEWIYSEILFTRSELKKLHRHFHHPSSGKLMALLKRSKLKDVDSKTRQLLEEISTSCETCQIFSRKPQRFKVSMPN